MTPHEWNDASPGEAGNQLADLAATFGQLRDECWEPRERRREELRHAELASLLNSPEAEETFGGTWRARVRPLPTSFAASMSHLVKAAVDRHSAGYRASEGGRRLDGPDHRAASRSTWRAHAARRVPPHGAMGEFGGAGAAVRIGAAGCCHSAAPLPGDPGYLELAGAAFRHGLITGQEWRQLRHLHKAATGVTGPASGDIREP